MMRLTLAALLVLAPLAQAAADERIAPASPQPDPARLAPGLAVVYAYPPDVRRLNDAESWLARSAEPGPPLSGLYYPDSDGPVLTSKANDRVAADIKGYIHFDRPGDWQLEFSSNDGLEAELGGTRIYRDDARHPCSTAGTVGVQVPEAGWYTLHLVYFQRLESSCLIMAWQPPGAGELEPVPDDAFARDAQ